ncbi:MAG TPA: Calx-beta domain-containing protein, partial [Pyrinomonadaceae bacterium]
EVNYTITATAGTPQSATVGSAFATNLAATVTESGNPVSGLSVTFTAPASGASGTFANATNTVTVATDGSGIATASLFTANNTAGSYNVTATAPSVPGSATFSLTNTTGNVTHFLVTAPASATAGSSFNFTVMAQDQFNNTVTGYAGTVHFTSSDGAATLPANSVLTNGVGTFSATLKTAGNQTITATDTVTAGINGTSNTIAVSAGAATHFAVTAPASSNAGSAFSFTVTAQDQFNNTVTSYAGTVHFTSTDGAAVLPANSTLTNGVGTFSATLKTAGNQTITATDTVTAAITGTSSTIAVNAGAATHFAVTAPASANAGSSFNVTVTALDQFDNTVTGYAGTVHFTSTDGNATLPANSTLTNGLGTFSATLRTAGNQTITATDTVSASITGTSNTIAISALAATHLAVSAPTNVALNIAFNFSVTAQDQFNNTATGYTGTVHFTSTDGAAVLPADSTLTNGVGTFSATMNTPGNQTITATDTVTAPITGTSNTIVVGNLPITIHDAQVAEPPSGSVNMIFTVTLTAPAGAGGVSVSFTTQDQPPALNHAIGGQDYTPTSGTVNFGLGEQLKTISVPILSDSNMLESNETFLVILSNPINGTIANGTATGTILINNQPGTVLISELRTSGPAGAGDDFVEVYNNSDSPLTVAASDVSPGYGLFKMGANCGAAPVLIGTIPNGTVIPARGHYLLTGSQYSLSNYGGTGAATGDSTLSFDIESDANVGLFSTTNVANLSSLNSLDGVGFGTNTGGFCDLLREGTTLPALAGSTLEYSFQRDQCGKGGDPAIFGGCSTQFPVDKNNNATDFIFADTQATNTPAGRHMGAPGPENLSATRLHNSSIPALLLDTTAPAGGTPNRVRDFAPVTNGTNGTLSIRRRFVNNTGAPVTRLRFRIVDISSFPVPAGIADVRALSSSLVVVNSVNDPATCLASTGSASTPCSITVQGTTLEQPPTQSGGGSLNSSMSAGTITLATPLAAGASINVQFLLGVQVTGSFKFYLNIEALP